MPVVGLVNLLFGIGFALIARDRIKADGPFATPAFPLVVMHAAGIVAPVALYFYAVDAAWAWMYWVDPKKLSGLAVIPLMVGHAVLVIGGWYGSAFMIRRGFQGALFYAGGAVVLLLLIFLIVGIDRLGTATDYAGYNSVPRQGVSVFAVELGFAFVVSLLALFGSAIYVAVELGRDARRVGPR